MATGAKVATTHVALVVVVLLSDLLFTGIVFGWAPMLLLLLEDEQFHELCVDGEPGDGGDGLLAPCAAQENRLNLIFALAAVTTNAASLPVGVFLDRCGPTVTTVVAGVVEVSALLLLAVADSREFDVFVPAYILLALGGCLTMMASYPASFVVPQHQTAVLAAISCLFDGSSVVFLVLYSLRTVFRLPRRALLIGFAVLAAGVYALLTVLWYLTEHVVRRDDARETVGLLLEKEIPRNSPVSDKAAKQLLKTHYVDYGTLNEEMLSKSMDADEIHALYRSGVIETKLNDMSIRHQLRTFEFAFLLCFASVHVFRTSLYIGSASKVLLNYGDGDRDFLYTKIFSLILPLGFVFVPAIDYVVERRGLTLSLLLTNAIGVLYNALVLVPVLPLQCATFAVFTGFRAFLYAVLSAFTAKTFGLRNLGTLLGIVFSVGSVVSLLEYPAVSLSNSLAHGDLSTTYWLSLALCVALFPLAELYRQRERARAKRHRQLLARFGSSVLSPDAERPAALSYRRSPCLSDPPLPVSQPKPLQQ
ncbi:hypothetical protein ATCC90586_006745 [Pythium insidiosum]|nr:hypothetical protein ATCC90586_006745 [Pythium insidiosum]